MRGMIKVHGISEICGSSFVRKCILFANYNVINMHNRSKDISNE